MSHEPIDPHEVTLRVRYCETDAMGVVHHSNYFNYFEWCRTELFKARGGNYRDMEERGYYLVIVHVECDYKSPARYDDELKILVWISRRTPAKLEHRYEIRCGERLLATGHSILACVDKAGNVQRITDELLYGTLRVEETVPSGQDF